MTVNTRSETIRDALVTLITENLPSLHVSPCEAHTWVTYPPAPYSRYGWRPAIVVSRDDGGPILTVPFCPDLIAEQTAELNDDTLRGYLVITSYLASRIAVRLSEEERVDDDVVLRVVHEVETEVDELNPSAMTWLANMLITILETS